MIYLRTNDKDASSSPLKLAEAIERALDGADYGYGELEALAGTASNCREFLGRLGVLLVMKQLVDSRELLWALQGWSKEDGDFLKAEKMSYLAHPDSKTTPVRRARKALRSTVYASNKARRKIAKKSQHEGENQHAK